MNGACCIGDDRMRRSVRPAHAGRRGTVADVPQAFVPQSGGLYAGVIPPAATAPIRIPATRRRSPKEPGYGTGSTAQAATPAVAAAWVRH
jgi:hypothetical protein